jgi:hypothetical protein
MVNYKITNERTVPVDTPLGGIETGYVERGGDILETKTNQIVKERLGMKQAKEMIRHLNFGGGFDGWTPTFFLTKSEKCGFSNEQLV